MHDQTLSAWHSVPLEKSLACLSIQVSSTSTSPGWNFQPNLQCVGAVELSWQPPDYKAHAALWPDKVSRKVLVCKLRLKLDLSLPCTQQKTTPR